jgi:hypothetical protein
LIPIANLPPQRAIKKDFSAFSRERPA